MCDLQVSFFLYFNTSGVLHVVGNLDAPILLWTESTVTAFDFLHTFLFFYLKKDNIYIKKQIVVAN